MSYRTWHRAFSILTMAGMAFSSLAPVGAAPLAADRTASAPSVASAPVAVVGTTDAAPEALHSHRLIVELASPPLVLSDIASDVMGPQADGFQGINVSAPAAQEYIAKLQSEQTAFVNSLQTAMPSAAVSNFIDENGAMRPNAYQILFNGMAIDPGQDTQLAMKQISQLPGVKGVYYDFAQTPDLYTSTALINAPMLWNQLGGVANAGAGVKLASMDGGIHKDAPMFSGAGYSYPPGYPAKGYGLTANNNGKIIVSRAYFRPWDPPSAGDENPWPGTAGTSHGVHTSGIAGGNVVTNVTYNGYSVGTMSGVAPKVWLMSYRVFYNSVTNNGSFYNAEGIMALEDIVRDRAQVVNNSWGGGPSSAGGMYDALDMALIRASRAGVFVAMSNGNAGPNLATMDHPSSDYINVAASTTSGTLASGRVSVAFPVTATTTATITNRPFGTADFGAPLLPGRVYTFPSYISAGTVLSTNVEGCNPWPANTFQGVVAVISRGTCEFGAKALNAQNAGASAVVIYNSVAGGEAVQNMGAGAVGNQVTITTIFVPRSMGLGMQTWYETYGAQSGFVVNTVAFQSGNTPDVIAAFSSRGPGVGNVLKPDVAAPGVNTLSQGYTDNAVGEARHLGYGQASGTSMAAPHVAGAAALIRQARPAWSNAYIKSALMSTAKYMNIFNHTGTPAQPLDMGAGRIDLSRVIDPGIILDPPSLSFGLVPTGTTKSIGVKVTSVATATETYALSTLYTGASFTATTALPGFSVSDTSLTLAAGESKMITVTVTAATSRGLGDNQGYIILDGAMYDGHMPAWARITPPMGADVLVLNADFSGANYTAYYTNTLAALGYTYNVVTSLPSPATLGSYKAVVVFTGDEFRASLPAAVQDALSAYNSNGGTVILMGQDAASTMGSTTTASFFYGTNLGGRYLRDTVSNGAMPMSPIVSVSDDVPAFKGISLDVGAATQYAGNVILSGLNETPTVNSTLMGLATLSYNVAGRRLDYTIDITSTAPYTLNAGHIHSGTVGVNGGVLYPIPNATGNGVTMTQLSGSIVIAAVDVARLLGGGMYLNFHTATNPSGEIRGQVMLAPNKDGAANQVWIDEIGSMPTAPNRVDPFAPDFPHFMPLLRYGGGAPMEENVVAMAHREQPQLGKPGVSYWGKSVYATFGLEGVNDGAARTDLMRRFFNWAWDMPTVTISNTTIVTNSSNLTMFRANFNSTLTTTTGVMYHWNFGDGSPTFTTSSRDVGHTFACGTYTVWVDAMSSYGNHAIGSYPITLTSNCSTQATITPAGGGTIVVNDAQGNPLATISVPAGAVASDVRLVHTVLPMPTTLPSTLRFSGQAFNLDVYLGAVKQEGYVFSQPTIVTLRYTDAQIQGQYEPGLKLYYWNGTHWVDAASSCSIPSSYVRDVANNTLSVGICHLTPFVLASSSPVFLPMISR